MEDKVLDSVFVQELVQENQQLKKENRALARDNLYLKQELERIKRLLFGKKSERYIPADDGQLKLDLGLEAFQSEKPENQSITYTRQKPAKKKKSIRAVLPAHLPRREEIIEPDQDTTGARQMGAVVSEILEYTPGTLYIRKIVRPKYVFPKEKIVVAPMPTVPIPKGNAGASLLAHLCVSKFMWHLPFYRQVQMFRAQGVELAASTIDGWFAAVCHMLEPLYNVLRKQVLACDYIQVDETRIQVLTSDKKNASHRGYHWVYYSPVEKLVCFDYQKGRGQEFPAVILKDFSGTIQADGYDAYHQFEQKENIQLLACNAHARRKFFEAHSNDPQRATYALDLYGKLYEIEREARDKEMSHRQRKELRQQKAVPLLDELENWLNQELGQTLPKSNIGKAVNYTIHLWPRLRRYVHDGKYEIDNNLVENIIRPVALGRKNYMFAGSHKGAYRAAMMYSLLISCKQHEIDPFTWLKHVLTVIPDYKANRLDELLPNNWKKYFNSS